MEEIIDKYVTSLEIVTNHILKEKADFSLIDHYLNISEACQELVLIDKHEIILNLFNKELDRFVEILEKKINVTQFIEKIREICPVEVLRVPGVLNLEICLALIEPNTEYEKIFKEWVKIPTQYLEIIDKFCFIMSVHHVFLAPLKDIFIREIIIDRFKKSLFFKMNFN